MNDILGVLEDVVKSTSSDFCFAVETPDVNAYLTKQLGRTVAAAGPREKCLFTTSKSHFEELLSTFHQGRLIPPQTEYIVEVFVDVPQEPQGERLELLRQSNLWTKWVVSFDSPLMPLKATVTSADLTADVPTQTFLQKTVTAFGGVVEFSVQRVDKPESLPKPGGPTRLRYKEARIKGDAAFRAIPLYLGMLTSRTCVLTMRKKWRRMVRSGTTVEVQTLSYDFVEFPDGDCYEVCGWSCNSDSSRKENIPDAPLRESDTRPAHSKIVEYLRRYDPAKFAMLPFHLVEGSVRQLRPEILLFSCETHPLSVSRSSKWHGYALINAEKRQRAGGDEA
jgi:hypothetical protein